MASKYNPTKEKIIESALALIKAKGYDQVTINDMCEASGISKQTFYYYFKTKEDVLMRFFHIPYEITSARMADIMGMDSPLKQFWYLIEPRFDHFESLGPAILKQVTIIKMQRNMSDYKNHKNKSPFFELEMDLLRKAQEAGEIRNQSNPKELMKGMLTMGMGCVHFWTVTDETFDLKKHIKHFLNVLFDVKPELLDQEEYDDPCHEMELESEDIHIDLK